VKELCSEALKDRHWRTLLKRMDFSSDTVSGFGSPTRTGSGAGGGGGGAGGSGGSGGVLTVGAIWDANPLLHRKVVQEVLATAQGEQALEQFLRDLREAWVALEVQLVSREGARIVVGWDVLFGLLEDNLNSLVSLKQSPYFRNVHEFQVCLFILYRALLLSFYIYRSSPYSIHVFLYHPLYSCLFPSSY
jgi:hypothetical protein